MLPITVGTVSAVLDDMERSERRKAMTYSTPSKLSERARSTLIEELNRRLADSIDLHSQVKVAHWNIKGPHFAALHPLFDSFAGHVAQRADEIAERAVALGGLAHGTVRHVATVSALPEYRQEATRDLEHVAMLAERFDAFLDGLRLSRERVEECKDADTVDLFTEIISEFEKHSWFLHATLEQ
jgi:starvation-inducible DNA-binding protein